MYFILNYNLHHYFIFTTSFSILITYFWTKKISDDSLWSGWTWRRKKKSSGMFSYLHTKHQVRTIFQFSHDTNNFHNFWTKEFSEAPPLPLPTNFSNYLNDTSISFCVKVSFWNWKIEIMKNSSWAFTQIKIVNNKYPLVTLVQFGSLTMELKPI